jgi:hypothetical protein
MFSMNSYLLSRIHLFASVAPLTASLIAPVAVLLDIPALTVRLLLRQVDGLETLT